MHTLKLRLRGRIKKAKVTNVLDRLPGGVVMHFTPARNRRMIRKFGTSIPSSLFQCAPTPHHTTPHHTTLHHTIQQHTTTTGYLLPLKGPDKTTAMSKNLPSSWYYRKGASTFETVFANAIKLLRTRNKIFVDDLPWENLNLATLSDRGHSRRLQVVGRVVDMASTLHTRSHAASIA